MFSSKKEKKPASSRTNISKCEKCKKNVVSFRNSNNSRACPFCLERVR